MKFVSQFKFVLSRCSKSINHFFDSRYNFGGIKENVWINVNVLNFKDFFI